MPRVHAQGVQGSAVLIIKSVSVFNYFIKYEYCNLFYQIQFHINSRYFHKSVFTIYFYNFQYKNKRFVLSFSLGLNQNQTVTYYILVMVLFQVNNILSDSSSAKNFNPLKLIPFKIFLNNVCILYCFDKITFWKMIYLWMIS